MGLAAALVLGLCSASQDPPAAGDPRTTIHAMMQRGEYADAWEAIAGLPEPHRSREEAALCYQAFDLARASAAARRAIAADPNDAPSWRILGDAAFSLGDLAEAREAYRRARETAPKDSHLSDAQRGAEVTALDQRAAMLTQEDEYRQRVRVAETRAAFGAGGWLVAALAGMSVCFVVAMRGKRAAASAQDRPTAG